MTNSVNTVFLSTPVCTRYSNAYYIYVLHMDRFPEELLISKYSFCDLNYVYRLDFFSSLPQ